jgi:ABC-2 type transport system ATP-binding protein
MTMTVIRTEQLSKIYRDGWYRRGHTAALQGLTLTVQAGEVFGFLGPNGAGKTTTIHLLLNFIQPTAGTAFLFEQPITDIAVRRRIGYLPESVNIHDYYRGARLLEFYAALLDLPLATRRSRAAALLHQLGLQTARNRPVSQYSKGMLQRLGFAQALLNDPDLLILDEPTSSLDPVGRKEFHDILLELKRRGKTVFISSHILSEVESVCDRVAILQNGQLQRLGTLQELSRNQSIRIVVQRLPAEVMDTLSTTAVRVMLEHGQVTIWCPDSNLRGQVETLLAQHHVEIQRLEAETQSLQDIFFSTLNAEGSS